MSTTTKTYDAIVLGSGQGSTPLARSLSDAGYSTLLVEKEYLNGTCVNTGCTPTKTMIASGRIAYLARQAGRYGVNVKVESVDMKKVRQRKRDIVDQFRGGSERKAAAAKNLEVVYAEGSFTGGEREVQLKKADGAGGAEETVKAGKWIFVSTGERPAVPKLAGLDEVIKTTPDRVLNSTTIMELDEVPESLIVLGGGYVGLEFAQLFARLGSHVHVIQRGARVQPREDPDVVTVLQDLLREEGLNLWVDTEASSLKASTDGTSPLNLTVKSTKDGTTAEIQGSHILLAAGRVPNTDMLNLPAAGIKANARGYIEVNEKLETNVPGVYAMGDCKGPPAFTHISYDDFRVLRDNLGLLPNPSSSSLDKPVVPHSIAPRKKLIPYVCYTDPQLAHVGLHLSEIPLAERKDIKVASMPMRWVARALETDEARGIMKVVVNGESGEILGFTCLGPEGGEIMSVMQAAMMGGLKWWDMREAVWAHPTWAESLNNLWGGLEDAPKE